MKKAICLLLACVLMTACGCASKPPAVSDGRDRPSVSGRLQVTDGKLCSEKGAPVMLRGVSSNGLPMGDSFINEALFSELSKDLGVNVFRIPVYTWGVGIVGYCTGGNREQLKQKVRDGVEYAKNQDMYAIVDWHILQDGDPNTYLEEAKALADRIGIMNKGRLMFVGTKEELFAATGAANVEEAFIKNVEGGDRNA